MVRADQIARAVVASANHFGVCPLAAMSGDSVQLRVRLAAAIGVAKTGLAPNKAAARLLGVRHVQMLSPSQWSKYGVTQVAVDIVIDVLGGAPLPPKPKTIAAHPRPKPAPKPKDDGPGYEPAALTIDVVARRQRERMGDPGVSFRRTDQDRKPPRAVVTAKLMGDPLPDRQAASDAAWERLRREEKRYGAGGE